MRLFAAALLMLVLGASSASAAPLGATRAVAIQNFAFAPATITVNVGDTVVWSNLDAVTHTATSNDQKFDMGNIAPETQKSFLFSTAGTFGYHCNIHPTMMGTVIVVAAATPPPTPVPTPLPTPVPTAVPTPVRTAPPTPQPASTAQVTASPTVATTAPATPSPTTPESQPTRTSSPSASSVSVIGTNAPARSAAPSQNEQGAPGPLLIAGGAVIVVGLFGAAVVLLRR